VGRGGSTKPLRLTSPSKAPYLAKTIAKITMSNTSIARRILEIVAAFERGEAPASAVAASLELHEPALEAVPRDLRDRLHNLSLKIIEEDVTPQEQLLLGHEPSRQALNDLRELLEGLITSQEGD
jgi:hypothetical protein